VAAVLEALVAEIKKSLGNKGAGVITIPGLVKMEKKRIPARAAQNGVPNPFKPGELMDRPAKPAYNKVKGAGVEAAEGHGEVADGADPSSVPPGYSLASSSCSAASLSCSTASSTFSRLR